MGLTFAAVSIGSVNFVNASGDSTIKACASRQTGTMRYISKGKCKKTESSLSWNQRGVQGLPGDITSTQGLQQIHIVDSTGRDFGIPISIDNANVATVFYDGGIWTISSSPTLNISGDTSLNNDSFMFWDSRCTQPIYATPGSTNALVNARTFSQSSNGVRTYYKPTGSPFSGSSLSTWYTTVGYGSPDGCKLSTVIDAYNSSYTRDIKSSSRFYTSVVQINPPPYLAPFSLVLK